MASAPSPRVAMETGSAAEIPEFKASTDFTTEMTMAMLTASRVMREAEASLTGAKRQAGSEKGQGLAAMSRVGTGHVGGEWAKPAMLGAQGCPKTDTKR